MRLRYLLPIMFLALGALLAPACSSDDGGTTASGNSNERDSGDQAPGDTDDGGTADIPGPDDLQDKVDQIPGIADDVGDCVSQAATFGSLYVEAMGGADGAEDAQRKAEDLKAMLPEDLHDDIDVVSDAIGQIADKGIVEGSEAMDSEEYNTAAENLTNYFAQGCGAGD